MSSFKGRLKKKLKKLGNKSIMKVIKPVKAFFKGPKEEPSTEPEGTRGAAASRLVNRAQQAGSGQISFNTMQEDEA
jgi:hypothetical protein